MGGFVDAEEGSADAGALRCDGSPTQERAEDGDMDVVHMEKGEEGRRDVLTVQWTEGRRTTDGEESSCRFLSASVAVPSQQHRVQSTGITKPLGGSLGPKSK